MNRRLCAYCGLTIRENRSSTTGWVHSSTRRKACAREPWQLVPGTYAEPAPADGGYRYLEAP